MKNRAWFAVFLLLIGGCSGQGSRVDKVMEDGVEVVLSAAEPYVLPDARSPVGLDEEWIIDLEAEDVERVGLFQIDTFAVDDDGNVYVLSVRSDENHIFKFRQDGQFDKSFGMNGQGPGEVARPTEVILTVDNELLVTDPENAKLVYFDRSGELLREVDLNRNIPMVYPLANGNFVVFGRMRPDMEEKYLTYPLELCDGNLEPIKKLDEYRMENYLITRRVRGIAPGFGMAASGERIYTGNEGRDYDIWVFDLQGNLVMKIRKKHQPLPVSDEIKERALVRYDENVKSMVFFPEKLPPFLTMAADREGTLYVVTYEEGDGKGENLVDVFDPGGAFIGRLSAAVSVSPNTPFDVVARKERFYYIRESETGFKQLVAAKILIR